MTKKSKNKKPALHPDTKLGKFARSVKKNIKTVLGGPAYAGYEAVKSLNSKRKASGMGSLIKYKKGGYVKPNKSSYRQYN